MKTTTSMLKSDGGKGIPPPTSRPARRPESTELLFLGTSVRHFFSSRPLAWGHRLTMIGKLFGYRQPKSNARYAIGRNRRGWPMGIRVQRIQCITLKFLYFLHVTALRSIAGRTHHVY